MPPAPAFGALVVGAGVHGLATAWHLALRGVPRVALVERFRLHHDRGSSHGPGRITRSTYSDARYVRLVRVAHAEDWPRLERVAGRTLIHRCDGVFWGPPDSELDDWHAAVRAAGAEGVERLDPAEARRRFPLFGFPDAHAVLHDRTGGVVAAADTLHVLDIQCRVEGVHVLEETRVLALDRTSDPIAVETDRGRLLAERVVVTAGAWVAGLVPEMAARVSVARQHVGYFRLDAREELMTPASFPVWVHLGSRGVGSHYGLPSFGRPGIKAAFHRTSDVSDDPESPVRPDASEVESVRAFLAEQLTVPVAETLHAECCLYTNTPDEHFVMGALPTDPRIVVGSACSGHGFKFGPLVGRLLAGLVTEGVTGVPEFEAARATFEIPLA